MRPIQFRGKHVKSEKAKSYLDETSYTMYGEPVICLTAATKAVIIAETEAEERHASELQQLPTKIEEGREREKIANDLIVKNRKELEALKEKLNEK